MKHFDHVGRVVAAVICAAVLSACSVAGSDPPSRSTAVAPYPPPPRRAEIPPLAQAADSLWVVGHWTWNGASYSWMPGQYVQRPTPTANWLPGYWQQALGGWVWTEGHWQS